MHRHDSGKVKGIPEKVIGLVGTLGLGFASKIPHSQYSQGMTL